MRCPDRDELRQWLDGELREEREGELEEHVGCCRTCEGVVTELSGGPDRMNRLEKALAGSPVDVGDGLDAAPAVPRYETLHLLGRGGMGVVWLARQDHPRRLVALKLLRSMLLTESLQRRFHLEAEVLGRLEHPGIARILEAGSTRVDGEEVPFIAMEYVEGERLDAWCETHDADLATRLALFLRVCDAVHYANLRGVLHRDLKPGNVLVDEAGRPVVIDFGLARVTDASLVVESLTESGRFVGTLPYMAPEQLTDGQDVDARIDVYGLGAVLFELVTGRPPHLVTGLTLPRAILQITEGEPPRPGSVRPGVPRELDWILAKALASDPVDRYQAVSELAADVERFLASRPLVAGPPSSRYRLKLFARRHRVGVTVAGVLAVGLVVASGGLGWGVVQSRVAEGEARGAEATLDFVLQTLADTNPYKTGVTLPGVRSILDRTAERLDVDFEDFPLVGARLAHELSAAYRSLSVYDAAFELADEAWRIRRDELGEHHRDTLASLLQVAIGHAHEERVREGVELGELALATMREVLGEDDLDTAAARHHLAAIYRLAGRADDAWPLIDAAIGRRREALGADHADTWASLVVGSSVALARDDLTTAESLARESLAHLEEALGPEHPRTLESVEALAFAALNQDRLAEAEALFERTLTTWRDVHADVDSTLQALRALAVVHEFQGRIRRAEERLLDARALADEHFGEESYEAVETASSLATLYLDTERREEAEELLDEVLRIKRAWYPESHPDILLVRNNLALIYRVTGRVAEAVRVLEEIAEASELTLGTNHGDTLRYRSNLGDTLAQLGDEEHAVTLLRSVLEDKITSLGEEHSDTIDTMASFASLLHDAGRHEESRHYYDRVLEAELCRLGPDHPEVGLTWNNVALLYQDMGRLDEALALSERSVAVVTSAHALGSESGIAVVESLADILAESGRHDRSEALFGEVIERCRALGPDHLYLPLTLYDYAGLCERRGDLARAVDVLHEGVHLGERALGEHHPTVLEARTRLARLLFERGDLDSARATLRDVMRHTAEGDDAFEGRRRLLVRIDERMAVTGD